MSAAALSPISLNASLDLLVGLMARFSGSDQQRRFAKDFMKQIEVRLSAAAKKSPPGDRFLNELFCALLGSARSLATVRGTFIIGSTHIQQQRDLRIAYLDGLIGLTSINRTASVWRILGVTTGSSSTLLLQGARPLTSASTIAILLMGAVVGYVAVDIGIRLYVMRKKLEIISGAERHIRRHWDEVALPGYRSGLRFFAQRYLSIYQSCYGKYPASEPTSDYIDARIEEALSTFPTSSTGGDFVLEK